MGVLRSRVRVPGETINLIAMMAQHSGARLTEGYHVAVTACG